jgi:hypothetical protein
VKRSGSSAGPAIGVDDFVGLAADEAEHAALAVRRLADQARAAIRAEAIIADLFEIGDLDQQVVKFSRAFTFCARLGLTIAGK